MKRILIIACFALLGAGCTRQHTVIGPPSATLRVVSSVDLRGNWDVAAVSINGAPWDAELNLTGRVSDTTYTGTLYGSAPAMPFELTDIVTVRGDSVHDSLIDFYGVLQNDSVIVAIGADGQPVHLQRRG